MMKSIFISIIITLGINFTIAQQGEFPPPNSDFKWHQINNVKLLVGNIGSSHPGWVGIADQGYVLNYPKGSNNDILAYNGIWLGAIVDGDTLASISGAYDASGESPGGHTHEFYPAYNPADTMYSISVFDKRDPNVDANEVKNFFNPNGTLHDGYYPISQEDILCQYNDYKVTKNTPEAPAILNLHEPMYARIIERTFAWDNEWYSDIIFYDYFIINDSENIWKDVYIGIYSDNNSGNFEISVNNNDDLCWWDESGNFMIQTDQPGTGGDDFDPMAYIGWDFVGLKYNNKETINLKELDRTFWGWEGGPKDAHTNSEYYRRMAMNIIDRTYGPDVTGHVKGMIAQGPVEELLPGDTLRATIALVGGKTTNQLRKNVEAARSLNKSGFQVPQAPNPPKFTLEPMNHAIKLDWHWKDSYEGYPPTESRDESRTDGIVNDFDGFKVYRSLEGPNGPWNLVAQYDSINGHGYDAGLQYEFIDKGLKNGFKYWYSVTSYDIRDDSSGIGPMESPLTYSVEYTVPGPKPEYQENDKVYAVPNPYRADLDYSENPAWEIPTQELRNEWYEIDRRIAFMNLPEECTIKIFTLNGILVNELDHSRAQKGHNIASWNLLNKNNHTVGSGIYYFVVEGQGQAKDFKQVNKFVIVK